MSTMALQLPSSFLDVEREEMEYVDGGGTAAVHLTGASVVGLAAGGASAAAIGAALSGVVDSIGLACFLGTAGTGTFVAMALVAALQCAVPLIASTIASNLWDAEIHGITIKLVSGSWVPSVTFTL